ncbi:aminoglycoside phosphotransferase family protein [Microbacterium immunditiarum]|uniref:Aminoglycoside phosphotransferase (APT) family kinase protein n=1 Tax=Microbacterium immunditiarum TaxID=337480 RepID=A0A7Y9GP33_9MICO|nr:aminoglycoside phosphotransferase family protein [Microbacterium immunditiarum]NYE20085.1 aminoglycoside phosphotransferase (APT) family kinase protein [Microbacterium immunditiarum]
MPDKPAAEVAIDEPLIRGLLAEQASDVIPDAQTRPLSLAEAGWDCEMWRLGDDLAVRMPRRAVAAKLVVHEHEVVPTLARLIAPSVVGVPAPLVRGLPSGGYPWHWSVVPWFDGASALSVRRAERTPWAADLARALRLMHVEAPAEHPVNPFRGVPLADRDEAVEARLASLRARRAAPEDQLDAGHELWRAAVAAPVHSGRPVWVHGDLHPGNLVADAGRLAAIIDFGDVTAGDPAYDLAVAWLAFDAAGRERFIAMLADRHDADAWTRARGWAVAVAAMLLDHSDDNPEYAALGAEALAEVTAR